MRRQDKRPDASLVRDANFMKFWTAETLSLFGTQISTLAIPLMAATTLHATPTEMGVLNAVQFAPYLLLTLFAGVWIDRHRKLPLLVGSNAGRAVLFGLLAAGAWAGALNLWWLCLLAFAAACLTVVFDLAYQSYLPHLVGKERLVDANGKVEASRSMAQAAGPGLGGVLVGLWSAASAVMLDAVSYVVSAVSLATIRRSEPEPAPAGSDRRPPVLKEIGVGLRILVRDRYLRVLASESAVFNGCNQIVWAVLILFLTRELDLPAQAVGVVAAMTGVGAFIGALLARRIGTRFGPGRTIVGMMFVCCAAPLLLPLAGGPRWLAASVAGLALLLSGLGAVAASIHKVTLRQTVIPPDILGRINAGYRFVVTGAAPIGALIGGALGDLIGLRATLLVGGLGTMSALLFFVGSPIPRIRDLSEVEMATAAPKQPAEADTP